MKKVIITLIMLQFVGSIYSQDEKPAELYYDLHRIHTRAISQTDLKAAATLSDIDEKYPATWVKEYVSVVVTGKCNGVVKSAKGKNENLNAEQMAILGMADYGSEVLVDVKYIPDNKLKDNDVKTINFALPVLPEFEAEFQGGSERMMEYLKEKVENRIPQSTVIKDLKWTAVSFFIDSDGKINNVKAIETSGSENIDSIIMEAICEMPQWIPAKDSNKVKVEQEFVFVLGNTSKICGLNIFKVDGRVL